MSRFLRLALVASAAAAALSLTAAPAYAQPSVPAGCAVQWFVVGAMSTCEPGSVTIHQLEWVCFLNGFPTNPVGVWGPEVPTFLPSIALCPLLSFGGGLVAVHTR
jgi:hypothetical protein